MSLSGLKSTQMDQSCVNYLNKYTDPRFPACLDTIILHILIEICFSIFHSAKQAKYVQICQFCYRNLDKYLGFTIVIILGRYSQIGQLELTHFVDWSARFYTKICNYYFNRVEDIWLYILLFVFTQKSWTNFLFSTVISHVLINFESDFTMFCKISDNRYSNLERMATFEMSPKS